MRRLPGVLLCFALLLLLSGASATGSFFTDFDAIERAADSILYIETDVDRDPGEYFTGSGFIAFNDSTFVTNYHVVEGAVTIDVYDEDGNWYAVDRVVAADTERDIAIVALRKPSGLTPLALATDYAFKRGQPVAAIGSPEGYVNSYSPGAISAVHTAGGLTEIQFTAAISHGSSGGALFNAAGEVIGITTSIAEEGQNLNFAVSAAHAIDLYNREYPAYAAGAQRPFGPPAPTFQPFPANPPDPEPQYPLIIGEEAYVGTPDDPWLDPDVVNVSRTKTVDWFTVTYRCADRFGTWLTYADTADIYSEYTYSAAVKPGELVNPGSVYIRNYQGEIRYIHVAVTVIHTTDGTTRVIPEEEWEFSYWELD